MQQSMGTTGMPHLQHAGAGHHGLAAMSLCHLDVNPKMQMQMPPLPSQVYPGHAAFEGILELRKEKSRDAARSRRGKENYEFYELAKMLPLPAAITSQLDKASIIRLSISFLKLRDFSQHGDPPWNRDEHGTSKNIKGGPQRRRTLTSVAVEIFETHQGTHILQSLDGFGFALSNDGRFLYISETVSIYLGLSQVEMTGSSMFDYVHQKDHAELAEQLGLTHPCCTRETVSTTPVSTTRVEDGTATTTSTTPTPRSVTPPGSERVSVMNPPANKSYSRTFCVRMKSTLTKRGMHIKSAGYRVVQINANFRSQFSFSLTRKQPAPLLGLVGIAVALPPPTINELLIDSDMYVTRLSQDFKVIYCEPRIGDLMDISAEDLTGRSLYEFAHAEDLGKLRKSHVDLLAKGQVLTEYYRLMNKHGGYVWVQTCATIMYNNKATDEQNVIAINYVLSGIEYPGCVMDMRQFKIMNNVDADSLDNSDTDITHHKDMKRGGRKSPGCGGRETERRAHKRKHSSNQDGILLQGGPVADLGPTYSIDTHPADVARSPAPDDNSVPLMYNSASPPSITETNHLNHMYTDDKTTDKHKLDAKNSRRKMERPRKRKRESETDNDKSMNDGDDVEVNDMEESMIINMETSNSLDDNLVGSKASDGRQSGSPDVKHVIKSSTPEDLTRKDNDRCTPTKTAPTSPLMNGSSEKWVNAGSTAGFTANGGQVSSSVRDLEEVMNRHLPASTGDSEQNSRSNFPADYSSGGVLNFHPKKSTIQWIGSQGSSTNSDLPASTLLRSLYASRESVIRSNVYNPRAQYYSDVQASLLTPPGGAGSETSPFATPQSAGKSSSSYNLGYSPNLSVSGEAYGMTPPSSVSPQDKYSSPAISYGSEVAYSTNLNAVSMPLKPQAYPLPAHANSHMSAYDRATAEYAAAAGGYYAGSFSAYNHASSPTPAHYRDTTKNASW